MGQKNKDRKGWGETFQEIAWQKNPKLNSTTEETTTNDNMIDLWHIMAKL